MKSMLTEAEIENLLSEEMKDKRTELILKLSGMNNCPAPNCSEGVG
jgi:hypothetical protein